MPARPGAALMDEAAEWIAQQMSEEGVVVGGSFVDLTLSMEWDSLEAGAASSDRSGMVQTICQKMDDEGIKIGPLPASPSSDAESPDVSSVPPDLVERVLSWEDDFLALAGVSREN